MPFLRFRAWLQELDETVDGIDAIFFEEVHGHRGTTAAQIYGGFLAHLTAWAEMNEMPYEGVPVGTIKRHITGKGNATKEAMIAAVRAHGFSPVTTTRRTRWPCSTGRSPTASAEATSERARAPRARRRPRRRRRREYGEPVDLFEPVAARWSLMFGTKISRRAGRDRAARSEAGPPQPGSQAPRYRSSTSRATRRSCGR